MITSISVIIGFDSDLLSDASKSLPKIRETIHPSAIIKGKGKIYRRNYHSQSSKHLLFNKDMFTITSG